MPDGFDVKTLATVYDRGRLVPFIGSGMSVPVCANWTQFVDELERQTGIIRNGPVSGGEIQRALSAIQRLRREGRNIAAAVRAAVYLDDTLTKPTHSDALASVFWPLVCSTNYDEVYLRATLSSHRTVRYILGRSEADCRQVLKHLSLPDGEALWALQGFLAPLSKEVKDTLGKDSLGKDFEAHRLEDELVVGHAEYRRAAHRIPHFRRCFAELFRTRSLFFLGSGLNEPYFRALFDEIIELSGPPLRPHFAIVEAGKLDPEFMREQYHIICRTYPAGRHDDVSEILREFCRFIGSERVRRHAWGYQVRSSAVVMNQHADPHFEVVRATLPDLCNVGNHEAVAASCGRGAGSQSAPGRGVPLLGQQAINLVREISAGSYDWRNDWVVQWKSPKHCYGIVARELISKGGSSRDRRSPDAIRRAFRGFLEVTAADGVTVAHVQQLGVGRLRVFQPWISLVQMARAYGQWVRDSATAAGRSPVRVVVHVVDPGVLALLDGGHIDLMEQLEDTCLSISVEIIDTRGQADTHHVIVDPAATIGSLSLFPASAVMPKLYAHPVPTHNFKPMDLSDAQQFTFRGFGLVSGSTLIIDYQPAGTRPARL
jgi:hypothetical protein